MAQNEANGDYNSIQVSLRGATPKNDLTYQVGYTYSHTNDSFDGITESDGDLYDVSDPYAGWKYDCGPSAFDIRNNFFTNFVYRIPLLKDSGHRFGFLEHRSRFREAIHIHVVNHQACIRECVTGIQFLCLAEFGADRSGFPSTAYSNPRVRCGMKSRGSLCSQSSLFLIV